MTSAGQICLASVGMYEDSEIWTLMVDGRRATHANIARILSLLTINSHYQILWPSFMPKCAAWAIMLDGGLLRHGAGRTFAPWALREVDRLAILLLSEHHAYTDGILQTLRGSPPEDFVQLPTGFVYSDPEGVSRMAPAVPTLPVDLGESPIVGHRQSWYSAIEIDYQRDRYLGHLTSEALAQRLADVVGNVIGLGENAPERPYWFACFTEVAAEFRLRHDLRHGWDGRLADGAEWRGSLRPKNQRLPELIPSIPLQQPYLVKYGRRRFLESMLREGKIRIAPASYYADASLNPAIRDDELSAELDVNAFGLQGWGGLRGPAVAHWPLRARVRKRLGTNYYVYCTSTVLASQLLLDFRADACVIVHDPEAFSTRVHSAVMRQLPAWRLLRGPVEYYDPLQVNEAAVDVLSWKHFRYAYQKEFRLAWLPPSPATHLAPLDLAVGGLEDICELVLVENREYD